MAITLTNTLEGGTNGVAVTAANSGGVSGNAFDANVTDATWTSVYATSPVLTGTLCDLVTASSTSNEFYLEWNSTSLGGAIGPVVYTRFYVYFVSALPNGAVNERYMEMYSAGATKAGIVFWGSANSGHFTWDIQGSGGGTSSTMAMSTGTVYRFEAKYTLSLTVGQVDINCYLGDSTSPLETLSSAANLNFGVTTIDRIRFGPVSGGDNTSVPQFAIDGFGFSDVAYLGPVPSFSGFTNTVVPTLTGSASVGGVLTAGTGTWTPTPGSYRYYWERADNTSGLNLASVGSTGATYTVAAADAGKVIHAGVVPQV